MTVCLLVGAVKMIVFADGCKRLQHRTTNPHAAVNNRLTHHAGERERITKRATGVPQRRNTGPRLGTESGCEWSNFGSSAGSAGHPSARLETHPHHYAAAGRFTTTGISFSWALMARTSDAMQMMKLTTATSNRFRWLRLIAKKAALPMFK
jgi:hypothetical protein